MSLKCGDLDTKLRKIKKAIQDGTANKDKLNIAIISALILLNDEINRMQLIEGVGNQSTDAASYLRDFFNRRDT